MNLIEDLRWRGLLAQTTDEKAFHFTQAISLFYSYFVASN